MWRKPFNIGHWIEFLNFFHQQSRNFGTRKTKHNTRNLNRLILSLKSFPRDMYFYLYFWLPNIKIWLLKNKMLRVNTVDWRAWNHFSWQIKSWRSSIIECSWEKSLFFERNSPLVDTWQPKRGIDWFFSMNTIKLSIFTDLLLVGLTIQSLYEGFVKFCFRLLTFFTLCELS